MFGGRLLASERNEAVENLFSAEKAVEPATKRVKTGEESALEQSTLAPMEEISERPKKKSEDSKAIEKALLAAAKILKIGTSPLDAKVGSKGVQKKKKSVKNLQKRKERSDIDRDRSTLFVGNVAVGTSEKELKHLFQEKCNEGLPEDAPEEDRVRVESVRLRGIALVRKGKEPVFVAARRGAFDPSRDTMNAYVVMNSMKSAEKAVRVMNNFVFKDRHLTVDNAEQPTKSVKKTVFVGNLPYDAKEEDLRTHFADCGDVVGVRIIRNKDAHEGKGFGFVHFADRASATAALMKNDSKFHDRKLRVTKCLNEDVAKETMEKEKKRKRDEDMKAYKEALKRGEHPRLPKHMLEARAAQREWKRKLKGKGKKLGNKGIKGGKKAAKGVTVGGKKKSKGKKHVATATTD